MEIKDLKLKIEDKTIDDSPIIFLYKDNDFIPYQYIHEIKKIKNLNINVVENIDDVILSVGDIFSNDIDKDIDLIDIEKLETADKRILRTKNTYIITKKISKECVELFKNIIVEVPELEDWQLKDYAYSLCEGVSNENLDNLVNLCGKDIYLLDNELSKISIFDKNQRNSIFNIYQEDGIFSNLYTHSVFDFTNAIMKKDINTLKNIYKDINNCDIEPIGVAVILYKNIRNVIKVQLTPNATPENTGIPTKQFWGIKYNIGYFNKDRLLKIFGLLTDIDRMIKTGYISNDILLDYMVCSILSM